MARILIVDDEENIRRSLKSALERRGHVIVTAATFREGKDFISSEFDVVLLDVLLPDGSGLDLLTVISEKDPAPTVIMISGHGDIDMAVAAIQSGAYDFIEKPLSLDRILVTIDNAAKTNRLRAETGRLASLVYGDFIGQSEQLRQLKEDIRKSAPQTNRFLILGENGTGKELVANLIHRSGAKSDGPFIAVNCAALPAELVESELFGHAKGAFTGATRSRKGKFAEADGGTIFLDEISEMTMEAQAKILRTIETRQITPVGSDKAVLVDCNIVAASNKQLDSLVAEGAFREDLFYRLNVVQFSLPPLRVRQSDIPVLAEYFLNRFAAESGAKPKHLSPDAVRYLKEYSFPGNVRELKNLMERANIYCDESEISASLIQSYLPDVRSGPVKQLKEAVGRFEREYIQKALDRNQGNMSETARQLGLERSHLYKKVKKYNI